jgi:hypothetical protein
VKFHKINFKFSKIKFDYFKRKDEKCQIDEERIKRREWPNSTLLVHSEKSRKELALFLLKDSPHDSLAFIQYYFLSNIYVQ